MDDIYIIKNSISDFIYVWDLMARQFKKKPYGLLTTFLFVLIITTLLLSKNVNTKRKVLYANINIK